MEESKCNKDGACPYQNLWKCPKKGFAVAGAANAFFFFMWYSQINLVSFAAYLALFYIIYGMASNSMNENKKALNQQKEFVSKETLESYVRFVSTHANDCQNYLNEISSLNDTAMTIEFFIWLYVISCFTSIFSIRFLSWIIVNLVLFYEPLNKKYPEFLFYSYLYVKQMVEGVFGVIECLIPKYEQVVESN